MAIAGNGWYERAIPSASLALKARIPAIYGSRPYAGDPSLAPHGTNLSATESSRNRKISAPRSAQALDQSLQAVRELIAHPLAKRTQIVDGLAATLTSLFQRLAGVPAQRLEPLELALQFRTHGG